MKKALFVGILGIVMIFGISFAGAEGMGMHGGSMGKPMMGQMGGQKHEMMKEFQAILLETIQMLKATAGNQKAKKDAEALETRMKALIEKHDAMHEEMMKRYKEMKENMPMGQQDCPGMTGDMPPHHMGKGMMGNPCNPCSGK